MTTEAELPPPEDPNDEALTEIDRQWLEKSQSSFDLATMPPEIFDAFMAGYAAGRATGLDDGYATGYNACDRELARLQRAAVAAARGGEAWPSLNPDNYR